MKKAPRQRGLSATAQTLEQKRKLLLMVPETIPTRLDTRPPRAQCALGEMVQSAREEADLSREDIGYRLHIASAERNNVVNRRDLHECDPSCQRRIENHTRWFKRDERMSQGVFDKTEGSREWRRPYGTHYYEYLELIELASSEAGDVELREAIRELVVERQERDQRERERQYAERAERIAGLIRAGDITGAKSVLDDEFSFDVLEQALLMLAERQEAHAI